MQTLTTLGQALAGARMLDVYCSRCPRHGRLSLRRLVAEHGADAPVALATAGLNADCPRRKAHQPWEACDLYMPQLVRLYGPARPPG